MSETIDKKVVIIEDKQVNSRLLKILLEDFGCSVLLIIDNMITAREQIPQLPNMGIDLVFLDGNLSSGNTNGDDGRELAKLIKKEAPSIRTIGFSGNDQDYVDIQFGKLQINDHNKLRSVLLGK